MATVEKKILALSWAMPPLVFPRSLQISRTLRQLKIRGWETSVVTVLPEAQPFATTDDVLADFYADAYRRIPVDIRESEHRSPIWLRAWRKIVPPADTAVDNWIRRADHAMRREIQRGSYDAIVTFAQPWVDHLVGLRLKRVYPGLPWLAHFSDPWVDSAYSHFVDERARAAAIRQERAIIAAADAVIFVNRYTADLVMAKYPREWMRKVHVVPHGFESDLLPLVALRPPRGPKMRIVHTGNFYGHRKPDVILKAIRILLNAPDVRDGLMVEFIGQTHDSFRELNAEMGLGDVVTFTGTKSYLDTLGAARAADLLMLIDAPADTNVFLPSKIVDYFMLRRPIIGITPARGASAELLGHLGCPVVDPADAAAIAAALRHAFSRWKSGHEAGTVPSVEATSEFDIVRATRCIEKVLEAITRTPKTRAPNEDTAHSLLSLEGVSALLDKRARRGKAPVTLVLWNSDTVVAKALLARPDVASVILPAPDASRSSLDPQCCGYWDQDTFGFILPGRLAPEIHYLIPGGNWDFGFRGAFRALLGGARRIVFHDVDLGTHRSSMMAVALNEIEKSLLYRLSQTQARWIVEGFNNLYLIRLGFLVANCRLTMRYHPGRVMLVIGSLGPGGSERQAVNTLLGLKAAGIADLSLLHSHPLVPPHDFFRSAVEEIGIPCLYMTDEAMKSRPLGDVDGYFLRALHRFQRLGMVGGTILNYVRVIREHQPEIVHTWLDEINVKAGIAAVLAGVPKVVINCRSLAPYNFPFYQSYMRPIYRLLARQPNVTILNNSEAGARDYSQWIGLNFPLRVVRNGFLFDGPSSHGDVTPKLKQDEIGAGTNVSVVGTIMRLSNEKRPHLWLDAAEHVGRKREDVCFVIIGDGPMTPEIEARVAASPLKDRIKLLGKRRDVTDLLSAMDVFVLTSSVEGLPNVLIEAQAEGVPVVSSDVGGVREVFKDGETGILVTQPTAEAFAESVMRVLDDPGLRQRTRERAPDIMREKFSVERMVRETLDVYGMA